MERSADPPSVERVVALLERDAPEEARSCLDAFRTRTAADRKDVVRSLRSLAEDDPGLVGPLCPTLTSFVADEERAVRLSAAKLFVAVAGAEPTHVRPVVEALADRLADDEEFYYVRARCAEALGYVALGHPEAVCDPAILADFRVGLSFDEPEVKEKLAKTLEYVALGDPSRLSHQVSSLAEHLDDGHDLVRYHLCTALAAVGCEQPEQLSDVEGTLRERTTDENPYVRGRAAEALGLLAGSNVRVATSLDPGDVDAEADEHPSFLVDRLDFCRRQFTESGTGAISENLGTIDSIRDGTEDVVEEMTSTDGDACPHCGLSLPESGPPMCPQCGTPY